MKTIASLLCIPLLASGAPNWPAIQTERWGSATVRPGKAHFVAAICATITRNRARYELVSRKTGVPWRVIASLHYMECGLSFREHLHNGDPLTARTRHVPAGRPRDGVPPFAWETSAVDALLFDHLDHADWAWPGPALQAIEAYNGTGYQRFHPDVPSPYLWSWTTLYTRGKYIEDGKWSATAISGQSGTVALLKMLE